MEFSGFGGNFAANLAAEIVKKGVGLLRDTALGDEETRALTRCIANALEKALSELDFRGLLIDAAAVQQARNAIEMIFRDDSAAMSFVTVALTGRGDPQLLTRLSESVGFDPKTLPFGWDDFLGRFLAVLEGTLHDEASRQGSPLRDRVAVGELFRLRCAVAAMTTSMSAVIDRLTAEFSEIDPTALFDQFFEEYLGLPDRPKPFGGRWHEVELLNGWLWDPDSRPKLLLVAPAGRGKSALLAHWLRQLPEDIAIAFVPISLRFQTSQPNTFIPALASRLAHLHGIRLPASILQNVNACRNLIVRLSGRSLENGQTLLVVIDGLDEAGDHFSWAGLLPNDLPGRVRIVVSARQLAGDQKGDRWMTRVAWDTFPEQVRPLALEGLDADGVREVLEGMGLLRSDADVDVVRQLHHLTSGDPLLIGLYAEALWSEQRRRSTMAPWRPVDLQGAVPGLKGFFERWLLGQKMLWGEEQPLREAEVRAALAILSQAIGPLRNSELQAVMLRAYGVSNWSVRETLAPLARFLIGDGANQGYVFSHSRLADFFGSEYVGEAEAERIRQSFLGWGMDVLQALRDGGTPPNEVPSYLLTYFAEHLVRAGGHGAALMSLICRNWLKAWERLDPTHRGFLADVLKAWDAVRADALPLIPVSPLPSIGQEVQCLLCVCSVRSPHELPAPNVFATALETGLVTPIQVLNVLVSVLDRPNFEEHVRALAPFMAGSVGVEMANLADLRPPSYAKVSALIAIAENLKEPDSLHVIDKAFRAAKGCDNEFEEVYAAISLIRYSPPTQQRELTSRVIDRLHKANRRLIQSQAIVDLYPFAGSAILPWANRAVEYFFEFSSNLLEPLAPAIFDLLSKQDRDQFLVAFLARPIGVSISDRGLLLNIVGPHLSSDQWATTIAELEELPAEDRTVILSSIITRAPLDKISRVVHRSVDELLSRSVIQSSLSSVNWIDLLNFVEPRLQRRVLDALESSAPLATSSDYWLRVLPQTLPYLPLPESKALAGKIMSQGSLHHDEAAVLPLLGITIKYLPSHLRLAALERVTARVSRHIERVVRSGEWRRLTSLGSLLEFMDGAQASELAERIFEAERAHNAVRVVSIIEIIHYLTPVSQALASAFLTEWSREARGEFSTPALLLEARKWLADSDYLEARDRLCAQARSETDQRMRAIYLAYVLRLLSEDTRGDVIEELVASARNLPQWDASWTAILSQIIEAGEAALMLRCVLPFLDFLRIKNRHAAFSLFVQVAIRHPDIRAVSLDSALSLLPVTAWPLTELVDVLPILPRTAQIAGFDVILQLLLDEQRGRPVGILAKIFPTLAELAGLDAATEVWEAIWDVSEWWP